MRTDLPATLPESHRNFAIHAIDRLSADPRLVGVAAGGSFIDETLDEFSDLDLVIAVEPGAYETVLAERAAIAASLGRLLASFTGEHVNEPRLLICLFDDPLLHVDLKFVSLADVWARVEDPVVLWEREGRLSRALVQDESVYPEPDAQWIEDRFWVWVHYAAAKIGRGELFETMGFLAFLRATVLGPLALQQANQRPSGVRKIEALLPDFARDLECTVAAYDAADCIRALENCVAIYRSLRPDSGQVARLPDAERASVAYLKAIAQRCTDNGGTWSLP